MKKQVLLFITTFVMTLLSTAAFKSNNLSAVILIPLTILVYLKCRKTYSELTCLVISALLGISVFLIIAIQLNISNQELNRLLDLYDFVAAFMSILYYFMSLDVEKRDKKASPIKAMTVDLSRYSEEDYKFPTSEEFEALS